jgi:hypothetical protein
MFPSKETFYCNVAKVLRRLSHQPLVTKSLLYQAGCNILARSHSGCRRNFCDIHSNHSASATPSVSISGRLSNLACRVPNIGEAGNGYLLTVCSLSSAVRHCNLEEQCSGNQMWFHLSRLASTTANLDWPGAHWDVEAGTSPARCPREPLITTHSKCVTSPVIAACIRDAPDRARPGCSPTGDTLRCKFVASWQMPYKAGPDNRTPIAFYQVSDVWDEVTYQTWRSALAF